MMMKFWIGVASYEHVKVGESGGFCQLCHGKEAPLKRMKKGDFIVYYSSKKQMHDKTPYQMFTAIGEIESNKIYQVQMSENFFPYRKDVKFLKSSQFPIEPLIESLSFIKNKKYWGYAFKYGHLNIPQDDFLLIAKNMLDKDLYEKLENKISRVSLFHT